MQLEPESTRIVNALSRKGFHGATGTFRTVFERYSKLARKGRLPGDPNYRSIVSMKADPRRKEPLVFDITTVVVSEHWPDDWHAKRVVTGEWAIRTANQQEAIRKSIPDCYNWRLPEDPAVGIGSRFSRFFASSMGIDRLLRCLPFEEGLDFFATLSAHWSYRFQPAGYMDHYKSLGWQILDSMHINDFIAQTAIMFIAIEWQAEFSLPIYEQLMRKKMETSRRR